jgi:hypothetical protein
MGIDAQIARLQEEDKELLHVTVQIEEALELAAKSDFSGHLKSMLELRTLDPGFAKIAQHCHMGKETVTALLATKEESAQAKRIEEQHQEIMKALKSFREELSFATADRTMAMVIPGMDLVNQLRQHIVYEQELLGRAEELVSIPAGIGAR